MYQNGINLVAELDSNDNFVSRFVYTSKVNVPDYMIKNGGTYRIISDDHPRLFLKYKQESSYQRPPPT